ncbi:MAG: proline dehydrogenase family protein [Deltaproteobacteria bacterium]|nr:proline dehydrogenase family protein [Deltaproteobacteria bacterium]
MKLARVLQTRAAELQSPQERRQQRELERMMANPEDKATLTQMTDQAFRSRAAGRSADQLIHILDIQGVPRFFSGMERALLKGFQSFGSYLPGVAIPLVKEKMREETANVVLPAEPELLAKHLERRRQGGIRMNVNYLGEALLGEDDAQRRLTTYLEALQKPYIEVISVKISTIYSQISALARRHTIDVLSDRLELLYRAAAKERFTRADGTTVPKLVYLDMEEYRDLWITVEAFFNALSRPGLDRVNAGIALQAYLPDAYQAQQRINAWARERTSRGGSPITIRIVKGANMEMERVEASMAGWPQAPFQVKSHTDANYKRMLHTALAPENIRSVHIGVGSHNLFDLAYALTLAVKAEVTDCVQLEMLEGMANHQRRALDEIESDLLLYAPATTREDFVNAIGYLVRRLDENTGPDNFLRHAFKLRAGGPDWTRLEAAFLDCFDQIASLPAGPRRTQDRRESRSVAAEGESRSESRSEPGSASDHPPGGAGATGDPQREVPLPGLEMFVNEPNTDFALEQNVLWAEDILGRWRDRVGDAGLEIPLIVAGEIIEGDRTRRACLDPSRPGVVVGHYREANEADLARALRCAREDPAGWRTLGLRERAAILSKVAEELRRCRGELMGAALANGGKVLAESDVEVSEAIDFVEFYAASVRTFHALETIDAAPLGVVVVVPPWNFPIAIPCGGIAAALAAGNTVILKPASPTVLIAHILVDCFWRMGVPREALQLLPCPGATVGATLVASPDVDAVILTGGTETAIRMLKAKPDMHLMAETGGKNATIVTAMSDREQAIKHVLHSAFGHAGQKCSATSLLILEAEVYDDPKFKETLCDAVRSLHVGSAWSLTTKVNPMITPPSGDLDRALKELEHGEAWAVIPRRVDGNPNLYSPGVKWDVKPGTYTHMTEFFGPVLAVMRAEDLLHALELANQTGYGLTAGLESLDDREQEIWRTCIRAGNLYINRVTTGAVVLRQPFGGVGKSSFGPGIKAGGPNYVTSLMRFVDRPNVGPSATSKPSDARVRDADLERLRQTLPLGAHPSIVSQSDAAKVVRAIERYDHWSAKEFGVEHDDVKIVGQDNIRRYRPVRALRVRVHADDTPFDIIARVAAAKTMGCHITLSTPPGMESPAVDLLDQLTDRWGARLEFVEESDATLADKIRARQTDRVRYGGPGRAPRIVKEAMRESGVYVAESPVLVEGRIELLAYVTEQSESFDYHRYGNLGTRAREPRRPVE